ncbi:hypothetical protein COS86_06630 [Candidatus Bathyarchaeota archaeon CG07_land_8_20_14_0_80_47_9]|jgi:hypothetical protein|nr:MAG: hypothetical protein COS86_06630 [Candidatus Bathyarchaeota archaeon CG07_land_8_20_14_0_80_47_9]
MQRKMGGCESYKLNLHPLFWEQAIVTCYFKHLQQVFTKAGIEVTGENKKEIDKIIHGIVRVKYKDCPATWKEVKKRIAEDEEDFVSKLKEAWSKQQYPS